MASNLLAVIPARGGSKRIPHKNIKDFNGLPLIAYSIQNALKSGLFSKVVVSTDDLEIAKTAQEYGATVPFIRSPDLANDYTGTDAVAFDAFQQVSQKSGQIFDGMCLIYATAPLLTPEHLQAAYNKFQQEKADYLFAGCEFSFPIQRGFYLKDDGTPYPVMPECQQLRSQDLPKAYQDAGQFYFYSQSFLEYSLKRQAILMFDPSAHIPVKPEDFTYRMYEMPRYRVIDIDTPEDWEYALILSKAIALNPELK